MAVVELQRGREGPVLSGHPWIFSGAVRKVRGSPSAGEAVAMESSSGRPLGWGFFNPQANIRVRVFSRDPEQPPEPAAVAARLRAAIAYRHDFLRLPERSQAYRLIHSEGDGLSGLVVDRFGDVLSLQVHAAAWEARLEALLDELQAALQPRALLSSEDARARKLEGLPRRRGLLRGSLPEGPVGLELDGLPLELDFSQIQKTGLYLDQRENWGHLGAILQDRKGRLLDACCHHGGFGLAALRAGWEVAFLDQSEAALACVGRSAERLQGRFQLIQEDVFDALRARADKGERFDALVLDPPRLARTPQKARKALGAYRELNQQAFRLLEPGGLCLTFSCTGHVQWQDFERVVARAASEAGRGLRVMRRLGAAADHPYHPSCPETVYLKGLMLHVT